MVLVVTFSMEITQTIPIKALAKAIYTKNSNRVQFL